MRKNSYYFSRHVPSIEDDMADRETILGIMNGGLWIQVCGRGRRQFVAKNKLLISGSGFFLSPTTDHHEVRRSLERRQRLVLQYCSL
jgi:hypothetical protein